MENIILYGDSLTQEAFLSGWASRLAHYFIRRAHITNCGLSGYNTRWYLNVLRDEKLRSGLLPASITRPLFATLLLGSNDLADNNQHVPLAEFKRNLADIITHILKENQPKAGVFVFTPPPVDQNVWMTNKQLSQPDRLFSATRTYRQAVMEVVAEFSKREGAPVILVDIHAAMLNFGSPNCDGNGSDEPSYDALASWTRLLYDGLHLNEVGGALFFNCLLQAMQKSPHAALLDAERLPMPLPHWSECA